MRVSAFRIGTVFLIMFVFSLPCGQADSLKGKVGLSMGIGPCVGITGITNPDIARGGFRFGGGLEYFATDRISLGASYTWGGFLAEGGVISVSMSSLSSSGIGSNVNAWHSFGVFGKLFLRTDVKSSHYLKAELIYNRPELDRSKNSKLGLNCGAGYRFAGTDKGTFYAELMLNSVFQKKILTYFSLSAGICFYLH